MSCYRKIGLCGYIFNIDLTVFFECTPFEIFELYSSLWKLKYLEILSLIFVVVVVNDLEKFCQN